MLIRKPHGFTLIELMIVIAVIGLLATITYPSYIDKVERASREDGKQALLQFANAMERYYSIQSPMSYEGAADGGADTGEPSIFSTEVPIDGSGDKHYDLVITAASSTAFTIQAQPKNRQANDDCGTLTYGSDGTRLPTTDGCW
ncbi:hypothetical protein A9Q99_09135 [Gammaproteobacteria bacterium 45_16_T64]|nr:hypothetical protein A9Q99_09135 [Gammaproteobacteria bacterium 45_16_T64]